MTLYITQGNFSQTAIAGMISKPDDREPAVRKLIEAAGGKLLHYYFTFGRYDFLLVSEGGDHQKMMASLAVAAGGGGVSSLNTTVAMTSADAKSAFENAHKIQATYRPPGK